MSQREPNKKKRMPGANNLPTTVDEYLATLLNDVGKVLQKHRHTIKSIAPEAEERIAYRIPIFRLQRDLVGFCAQKALVKKIVRARVKELSGKTRKYEHLRRSHNILESVA